VSEHAGHRRQLARRQERAGRVRCSIAGLGRVQHAQRPANSPPRCAAREPQRYAAPSEMQGREGLHRWSHLFHAPGISRRALHAVIPHHPDTDGCELYGRLVVADVDAQHKVEIN
jgi:hypothetical protein